jgi:hypothetical protein
MHSMKSMSLLGKLTFVAALTAGFAVQPSLQAGTLFVNAGDPGCSPTGPLYLWRSAKLSRVCSDKLSQRLEAEGAASSFQGVEFSE